MWKVNIPLDYSEDFLVKEDSLKSSFYHHLRMAIGDTFLKENHLRIYTEFNYRNMTRPQERADLAIVRLNDSKEITEVLFIIEFKYKQFGVADCHYQEDVEKALKYISIKHNEIFSRTHYYLAFLNQTFYEPIDFENRSYTTIEQRTAGAGRITELLGYHEENEVTWYCISH